MACRSSSYKLLNFLVVCCGVLLSFPTFATSQTSGVSTVVDSAVDDESATDSDLNETLDEILAGHSYHGEAFNEGPRQAAYLMGETGNVNFPVTTKSGLAQKFINQGVGQLHGFWYLEAERSFRQAIALDKTCAMAYWGAAWATSENLKRARGFIAKAVELKNGVSEHDQLYIEALNKYLSDKPAEKSKRAAEYLKDLESIVLKFPDDLEAKAFVAHRTWQNGREGIPVSSYLAVDALLKQIFAQQPLHPAHHYSIHLWDTRHPENALKAAADCGPSAPGVAHMWHMPGHIYSRLHRYEDAIYQQEASARVDHSQMMRDQVMPDEIHNFAHNNEWLIRNMAYVGRVDDAVTLAKNMLELPQHPKYNTLEKQGGSASYGRQRLMQLLREFGLHEEAIRLCRSRYLTPANEPVAERVGRLRLLGCSAAISGATEVELEACGELNTLFDQQTELKTELPVRIARLESSIDDSGDRPPLADETKLDPAKTKLEIEEKQKELTKAKSLIGQIEKAKLAVDGYRLVAEKQFKAAHEKLTKATGEDVSWLAELQFLAGDVAKGLETARQQVKRRPSEVIPLARLAFLQQQNGEAAKASETFEKLRAASGSIDLTVPVFSRLNPIAISLKLSNDWQQPHPVASDLGYRPSLDSLGPFRWSAPAAPDWSVNDLSDRTVGRAELSGQPHLLIFYLGHGCLHCAEQLNAFAPRAIDFENSGIKLLAISSDDREGLQQSIDAFTGEMPIRLASDASLDVFRKFRAFDGFENQPLHGTFLIDGAGKIRWQDIGFEPFMDHEFLLAEAKRLLANELNVIRIGSTN